MLIGNDHGAVDLKVRLINHLEKRGYTVENCGVDRDDSVDYPDIARLVCTRLLEAPRQEQEEGPFDFAILCCGTGIGISIAANKIQGIRCALPQNIFAATMAREHNDANAIAFGGRIAYEEPVEAMLDAFIDARHQGGRHQIRVQKIMDLEG
ncbi:RpiB/LacA/LacB family sugar-phosphate isomerase [Alkalispirochaeta americana]|uniref:RpiB/LacA/LacB family sugar-phosphate isomerase n=1 Tax=Alkalispirochaeta americana TaxID=159291 RepID=UPI002E15EF4A